jgi:hypothetical protein
LMERYPLRSTMFGVWVDGRRLASGALGDAWAECAWSGSCAGRS